MYELSRGRPYLHTAFSVTILVAYFVGNRFSCNVCDILSNISKMPYLQELPKALYIIPADKVMIPIDGSDVLSLSPTYRSTLSDVSIIVVDLIHSEIFKSSLSHKSFLERLPYFWIQYVGIIAFPKLREN